MSINIRFACRGRASFYGEVDEYITKRTLAAGSRILELHGQKMIDNQFEPGAKATTQLKDLRQALDLAEDIDLALPFVTLCRDQWQAMTDAGHGDLDQAGYYEFARSVQPSEDSQEN